MPLHRSHLVEAAQAEGGVVQAAALQELLSAALDVHQRHLGVLVAVVDGEEHVPLDAHSLQAGEPRFEAARERRAIYPCKRSADIAVCGEPLNGATGEHTWAL